MLTVTACSLTGGVITSRCWSATGSPTWMGNSVSTRQSHVFCQRCKRTRRVTMLNLSADRRLPAYPPGDYQAPASVGESEDRAQRAARTAKVYLNWIPN